MGEWRSAGRPEGAPVVKLGDDAGTALQHPWSVRGWTAVGRTALRPTALWAGAPWRLERGGARLQPGRLLAGPAGEGPRAA